MSDDLQPRATSSQQQDRYSERLARRIQQRMERGTERMQYRMERRAARYVGGATWPVAMVLIIIGVILLLQNTGAVQITNWWALLILLAATISFGTAYGAYRNNGGRLNVIASRSLVSGFTLLVIAAFFLLDLDWERLWPLLLILIGIAALVNSVRPEQNKKGNSYEHGQYENR